MRSGVSLAMAPPTSMQPLFTLMSLFRAQIPFLDIDVNVRLPIEPIIVRLPLLARIRQAKAEMPDNMWDKLVDLAQ